MFWRQTCGLPNQIWGNKAGKVVELLTVGVSHPLVHLGAVSDLFCRPGVEPKTLEMLVTEMIEQVNT